MATHAAPVSMDSYLRVVDVSLEMLGEKESLDTLGEKLFLDSLSRNPLTDGRVEVLALEASGETLINSAEATDKRLAGAVDNPRRLSKCPNARYTYR